MSLFRKLFPKKESTELVVHETPVVEEETYPGYSVQHFPYSGYYFALHKGRLLKQWHSTGFIEYAHDNDPVYATNCPTEQIAWNLVLIHQEQQTRATVRTLKVPSYLLKNKDGNTIDI